MTDPADDDELGPRVLPVVPARPVAGAEIAVDWGQAVHDVTFLTGTPDVRDGWGEDNIAANVASRDLLRRDGQSSPISGFAGVIIGIVWRRSGTITAGKISLYGKSGSQTSEEVPFTSTLNTATSGVALFAAPYIYFTNATAIRIAVASTADLLPLTVDFTQVGLLLRYDYVAGGTLGDLMQPTEESK